MVPLAAAQSLARIIPNKVAAAEEAAAALREWDEFTSSQSKAMQAGSGRRLYHRFHCHLNSNDYMAAKDDETHVMPPPPPTEQKPSMMGVSFFDPIDDLCRAVHGYYQLRKPGATCHIMDPDTPLPEGIAMHQDTLLIFKPERSDNAKYPSCFRSMSNTRKGKVYVHGLHVVVFPTRRMSIEELQHKIEELRHSLCPCSAAPEDASAPRVCPPAGAGSGSGGGGGGGSRAVMPLPVQQKTRSPSCQYMRLVCEALHAHWQDSSTPPNASMMCYLLLHDIGARDSDLETLLQDSWAARLVYKARVATTQRHVPSPTQAACGRACGRCWKLCCRQACIVRTARMKTKVKTTTAMSRTASR